MNVFLHLLGIGVASNLDNLGVGVAYGVRRIAVPALSNLIIAAIAVVFSILPAMAGGYLGRFMPDRAADAVGAVLIIGVGMWVMRGQKPRSASPAPAWRRPSVVGILREPELADSDHSGAISLSESLVLGVALSLNCLTNGFSAGLWKLDPLQVAVSNGVLSYVCLWFGTWLGRRYGAHWLGSRSNVLAGCLLILLGVRQLVWG